MMNVLGLSLVLTSLVTAAVWSPPSPNPSDNQNQRDVMVKEGHRVVVVEYEKEGNGNTKVLITPQESHVSHNPLEIDHKLGYISAAEHKLYKAATATKDKIESAIGKTKDMVSDVREEAEEAFNEAVGKVKDTVVHKTHEAEDAAEKVKVRVKDAAEKTKEKLKDAAEKTKHLDVVDTPKRIGEDMERNLSTKTESVKASIKQMAKQAERVADRAKEEGQKNLYEILGRGIEVVRDATAYMLSSETIDSLIGLAHLLGFSMAYGMCVWVTFISSYVLVGALPRQQFGMVQSKIYPVYFKAMAYSVGLALLGYLVRHREQFFSNRVVMFWGCNLLASLLMVLVNLIYLEPRATKVMFQRMKMEKEEGRGKDGFTGEPSSTAADHSVSTTTPHPGGGVEVVVKSEMVRLSETLKKLNAYSSFLNVLTLMSLTWHLAYLNQSLHME